MELAGNILILIAAFAGMEAVAWSTHKFIMHGLLWPLHKDHHKREDGQIFEKNDSFFLFFATPAILLFLAGIKGGIMDYRIWAALGITLYGLAYFLIHDVFIHQRFRWFRNIDNPYLRAVRRAHKIHHKVIAREGATCFGMLLFPTRFLKEAKRNR